MKSDYFEGELTALHSVIGVCRSKPGASGRELESVFQEMYNDLLSVVDEDTLRVFREVIK